MFDKILAAGILTVAISSVQAQTFSADLAIISQSGEIEGELGKVYAGSSKVRVETPDLRDSFFTLDPVKKTAYFVRPNRRIYMDAKQSSRWTELLIPVDSDSPCKQWQAMAQATRSAPEPEADWRCVRLGDDMLDGHRTIKYRVSAPGRAEAIDWIDPSLNFLVRSRTAAGSGIDIKNVESGPQKESLFEIPAGYAKFDPQQVIELIKHSDVWVEPPK